MDSLTSYVSTVSACSSADARVLQSIASYLVQVDGSRERRARNVWRRRVCQLPVVVHVVDCLFDLYDSVIQCSQQAAVKLAPEILASACGEEAGTLQSWHL